GREAVTLIATSGAAVAVCFLVVHALQDPLKALLSREDEIPIVFAFSSVVVLACIGEVAGIPETLLAIVLGSALSQTVPDILEAHIRPFRDVFLILVFVFFGVTVDFTGTPPLPALAALAMLAVASKLISGVLIGKAIHGTPRAGVEIWSHTAARGEFSIALAALFGSAVVSGTVAALVLATSIAGAFLGKYGSRLLRVAGRHALQRP
ncbi:MAG: cation:proton antiporter, partial [Methanomicrobiales archaeon]|nr:cation:proton antiporter [Methanomicrobiales archaeon]